MFGKKTTDPVLAADPSVEVDPKGDALQSLKAAESLLCECARRGEDLLGGALATQIAAGLAEIPAWMLSARATDACPATRTVRIERSI